MHVGLQHHLDVLLPLGEGPRGAACCRRLHRRSRRREGMGEARVSARSGRRHDVEWDQAVGLEVYISVRTWASWAAKTLTRSRMLFFSNGLY